MGTYDGMTQERLNELWRGGHYAVYDYYNWLLAHVVDGRVDADAAKIPLDVVKELRRQVDRHCDALRGDPDGPDEPFVVKEWLNRRGVGFFAKCRLCGWDGHFGDTSEPHLSYHRCPVCKGRELDVRGGGELT